MYKQLRIDIFNVKTPIVEEQLDLKMKRKQDNKAEVVDRFKCVEILEVSTIRLEDKKENVIDINF